MRKTLIYLHKIRTRSGIDTNGGRHIEVVTIQQYGEGCNYTSMRTEKTSRHYGLLPYSRGDIQHLSPRFHFSRLQHEFHCFPRHVNSLSLVPSSSNPKVRQSIRLNVTPFFIFANKFGKYTVGMFRFGLFGQKMQ